MVSHEMVDEVLAAYSWLDAHESLLTTLVGLYQKNPKAAASNAVAEVCERRVPGFQRPNPDYQRAMTPNRSTATRPK